MKKLSLILSALLLLGALTLTACTEPADGGKDTTAETAAETPAVTTPETTPDTIPETEPVTESAKVTYTVTVKDQDGNPLADISVMMCQDELCMRPVKTDANGVATFSLDENVYRAKLNGMPEGYTGNEDYIDFPEGSSDLVITLTKAA